MIYSVFNHSASWPIGIGLIGLGLIVWDLWNKRAKRVHTPPQGNTASVQPIHKAVIHIAKSIGEWPGTSPEERVFPRARAALRQAAVDGAVQIRGKRQLPNPYKINLFSGVATAIPKEYWENYQLNVSAAVGEDWALQGTQTLPQLGSMLPTDKDMYGSLEIDLRDVETRWPIK